MTTTSRQQTAGTLISTPRPDVESSVTSREISWELHPARRAAAVCNDALIAWPRLGPPENYSKAGLGSLGCTKWDESTDRLRHMHVKACRRLCDGCPDRPRWPDRSRGSLEEHDRRRFTGHGFRLDPKDWQHLVGSAQSGAVHIEAD